MEVKWRLITLISGGGFPANQMDFGSNSADLFCWGDKDEDSPFAQDAPLSGQYVKQWKLPVMARKAALKEVANSELCRRLPYIWGNWPMGKLAIRRFSTRLLVRKARPGGGARP